VSARARPQDYAAAAYELALEAWTQPLGAVQRALKADPALRAAALDPGGSVQARLALLSNAVPGGLAGPLRQFLGNLLEAGQLDQLEPILVELERLVRRRAVRQVAQVTSAVPLTAQEQEALRARLARRFGADLELEFHVDPAVLGGVYLRVGDQVIDGTVAGKLARLRDRLAE
jgi:F-type H+-transporting ATPase subunit delta